MVIVVPEEKITEQKEKTENQAPKTEVQNEKLLQIGTKPKQAHNEKTEVLASHEESKIEHNKIKQFKTEHNKTEHKEHHSSHHLNSENHAKKKPVYKNIYAYIAVALILIIAGGIFIYLQKQTPNNVLVKVNGEVITTEELQKEISMLPPQYTTVMDKNQLNKTVIEQLILKKLLLQEVKAKNLQTTDDDVNKAINNFLLSAGLTKEEFIQRLNLENSSIEDVKSIYKDQLAINKLLTQELFNKIIIPEQTIKDYYDKNKHDLIQLKASHILICYNSSLFCDKNRTEEKALALGNDIKKQLNGGKSFDELAKKYSDDPSAKNSGDLGWFGKGSMVLSFEEAAMKLKKDEISPLIKTQFGYHLIKLIARNESFEEIKPVITEKLSAEKKQTAIIEYLNNLKNKAVISYSTVN